MEGLEIATGTITIRLFPRDSYYFLILGRLFFGHTYENWKF
jgi:hypothetical protein